MRKIKFLLLLCYLISFYSVKSQTLVANPQNSGVEGGELKLMNSNASYNPWHIDNYSGNFRVFQNGNVFLNINPTSGLLSYSKSLKINNALRIASENTFVSEGSISEGTWGNYILTNNGTTRTLRLGVANDSYTRGEIEIENNNSPSSNIFFKTTNVGGGAKVRMKINAVGNVGIGTTSPIAKLDVVGDGKIGSLSNRYYLRIASKEWPEIRFQTPLSDRKIRIGAAHETNSHYGIGEGDFYVYTSTANSMPLIVNKNGNVSLVKKKGNVGIGTTTPDAKLTVKGNIHTQEVKVDLNGAVAPDYVFKEDYKLKSLDQVQAYINKNGHLPNIPSAAEMEKEGVLLKEMNLKLLEKIEELTLYTLEQQKEIERLKISEKKHRLQEIENENLKKRLEEIENILTKITNQ